MLLKWIRLNFEPRNFETWPVRTDCVTVNQHVNRQGVGFIRGLLNCKRIRELPGTTISLFEDQCLIIASTARGGIRKLRWNRVTATWPSDLCQFLFPKLKTLDSLDLFQWWSSNSKLEKKPSSKDCKMILCSKLVYFFSTFSTDWMISELLV